MSDKTRDIIELEAAVAQLPAEHRLTVQGAVNRVVENVRRRRRITQIVNEALSQLRLDMKYLIFDLECTRKERDEARNAVGGDLQ